MNRKTAVEAAFQEIRAQGVPESLLAVYAWANSTELKKAFGGQESAFIAWLKEYDASTPAPIPAAASKPTEQDLGVTPEQFKTAIETPAASIPVQPASHQGGGGNVVEAYEGLLKSHMAAGMTRGEAYEAIAKDHPDLHDMFLNAVNQSKPEPEKKPLSRFETLVDSHMAAHKCSRGEAIAHLARTNPAEHEAFLKEVNS